MALGVNEWNVRDTNGHLGQAEGTDRSYCKLMKTSMVGCYVCGGVECSLYF